jgi:ABC-type nickel/cobalt efflux system permease component RcnA
MKQPHSNKHNSKINHQQIIATNIVKRTLFYFSLFLGGSFFIQSDDKSMYIVLLVIVVLVGLANLIRGLFPKNRRHGRDKHGHGHHNQHNQNGHGH